METLLQDVRYALRTARLIQSQLPQHFQNQAPQLLRAAEAAVGLGIVIAMFRNKETMNINEIDLMKW